jgi:hypothetical protein
MRRFGCTFTFHFDLRALPVRVAFAVTDNSLRRIIVIVSIHSFIPPAVHPSTTIVFSLPDRDINVHQPPAPPAFLPVIIVAPIRPRQVMRVLAACSPSQDHSVVPITPYPFTPFASPSSEPPIPGVYPASSPKQTPPIESSWLVPDFAPAWMRAYHKAKAKVCISSLFGGCQLVTSRRTILGLMCGWASSRRGMEDDNWRDLCHLYDSRLRFSSICQCSMCCRLIIRQER